MQEEVKVNKTTDVIAEALEENGAFEEEGEEEEEEEVPLSGENWTYGSGEGSWQSRSESVGDRMKYLHNCRIMSDLGILACDENWWFGETVKDFTVKIKEEHFRLSYIRKHLGTPLCLRARFCILKTFAIVLPQAGCGIDSHS